MTAQNSGPSTGKNQDHWVARRLRLLVVDDEPDVCELLRLALGAAGKCDVHAAHDAKAALRALDHEEAPFDGIFLDIQMPGTTGIELCSIIRGTPGYGDVPIMMLTAMTERDYLRHAFANGAHDYVTKPFDINDISKKFAKLRADSFRRQPLRANVAGSNNGSRRADGEVIRSLEDAAAIRGVSRCIGKEAFQTYLLRSHGRFETPISLKAIKIAQVHRLYSQLPDGEYQAMVRRIAEVIAHLTTRSEDVFTYFGNGIFLSSSIGKSALSEGPLSAALECEQGCHILGKNKAALHLILGAETVVGRASKGDVIHAIKSAVDSADAAENAISSWGNYREWMSHKMSVGRGRSRIEQAAYEQILNDFIEAGELGWK
jgi:CheY-like chemotaxis protein